MKPLKYRLWVCLLFALLLPAVFGTGALADDEGTCGENLTWKLEGDLLTVSGTGRMDDFTEVYTEERGMVSTAPWDEYRFKWIVIEEGVTSVGNEAFFNHVWVVSVSLPETLDTIGEDAFCSCGMAEINIPASVTTIGTNAFSVCHNLKSIKLPDSVTDVEFGVFQSCQVLESVTLPEHVKSIGESAFERCESLKEINLPASLVKIGRDAFAFCDNLQRMIVEKDSYAEKYCAGNNLPYIYANTPVLSGNKCGDNLEWELENGTLTISGTGKMDDYKRLVGGGQETSAPWDGQKITQVVLESGVASVGAFAFWGCGQLKTVVLPDTVTAIGKYAFEKCTLLREITLPEGVDEIGKKAFSQCESLETIVLPASVSSIGEDAFAGCGKLKAAAVEPGSYAEQYCATGNLPYNSGEPAPEETKEPVKNGGGKKKNTCGPDLTWMLEDGILRIAGTGSMDDYVQVKGERDKNGKIQLGSTAPWNDCVFSRVVIEEGVLSIGAFAFENCAMTEVSLPGTLVSVGQSAFEHCEKLETVALPDSVTDIGMFAFNGCTGLTEIRLSAALASVGAAAFDTCTALKEITLPESVADIGMYAFHNCAALRTVTLPASLQMIGEYAFDGCQALQTVIVQKDSYAEQYCIQKELAYFYEGGETISTEAPLGICGKNMTWKLDGNDTLIISGFGEMDDYDWLEGEPDEYGISQFLCTTAPWYGRGIRKVVIEEGVTRIGSYAFYQCEELQSVVFPDTLQSIGSEALGFTSLVSAVLPDSVVSFGEEVFHGCRFLENVRLPSGMKVIPEGMFCACDALRDIILPDTLQRIETMAFAYCDGLKEISLPSSLFFISGSAFDDCAGLNNYIAVKDSYAEEYCREKRLPYSYPDGTKPDILPEKEEQETKGACGENLTWILEDGKLTISGSGRMADYDQSMEGKYTMGITAPWDGMAIDTVVIEEGVTSVGNNAFALQEGIKKVFLPETLTEIGRDAFWCCMMTEIDLPDAVKTIGSNAFSNCSALQRVKLPANIGGIEFGVFQGCYSLEDITLPDTVRSLSDYAFSRCTGLSELRLPASVAFFGDSVFEYCPNLKLILAEKGGAAETYCTMNGIAYSYAENE